MHGPMAVPLAVCLGACFLAAGGCAGSARQSATAPANAAAPPPIPIAQRSPPVVPAGSAAAASTPAQSAGGSTAQATTPPDPAAAAPGEAPAAAAAITGGPASPAAASAAAPTTAASANAANANAANAPASVPAVAPPVMAASAPASTAPASGPAPAVAPAGPAATDGTAVATSAPLPPSAAPPAAAAVATRVMLADELPYAPAHLRARDARVDHHHGSNEGSRSRDGREAGKRPYHPAPGIVVDVVDAQGGASAAALQRTARNLGYWPFRQCYEDGLRRDQHLAGKVSLELAVSPSGAVDRSVVTATTVRDEIVAACLAREAQHLALPSAESPTTARVDVSLAVGDEPVATGRPVPNAEPIRQSLRGSWSAARRCYANRLASHPGIGGRMDLHFHVRHGEIVEVDELASAGESGGRFGDPDVTRCVLGVYRTAHLPAPHGARERSFVYALHFESEPVVEATAH